jgi:hypothetical protein
VVVNGAYANGGIPRVNEVKSIPAPIGGWNARDPIAAMPEDDAVIMDNFWPTTSDVMLRNGWEPHATGIGDQVETVMAYNAQGATPDLLFAAGNGGIYDVTGTGAVGAAEVTGLNSTQFQYVNFTNSSGTAYLICVNGADDAQYYNGTTWIAVDAVSTPAITGVSTDDLINVAVHKRRLWFVEEGTLNAWYLPVDAVGGAATAFSLAGIARLGGYLVSIGTWTLDAGEGPDDYWVAVTSEGEVIVYRGTDVSSLTTWTLMGVWRLGRPVSYRCFMKYQGDLLYISTDGVVPLSKALISERADPRIALSDKIDGAMSEATSLYYNNFGWGMLFYPGATMLIVNIPVDVGSNQQQYCMNTITKAWARFTGLAASCWELFGNDVYFGSDGQVNKFWIAPDDDGSNINGDCMTAFNYFGTRSTLKRWLMARPILTCNGTPSATLSINVNYDMTAPAYSISFTPVTYAVWDTALWDQGVWGGGLGVILDWQTVAGIGFCAAARLQVASQGLTVRWQATDFVHEFGGFVT